VDWITGVRREKKVAGLPVPGSGRSWQDGSGVCKASSSEGCEPPLWLGDSVWLPPAARSQECLDLGMMLFFYRGWFANRRENCSSSFITISKHCFFFNCCVIRLMDFKIFMDIGTIERCSQLKEENLNSSTFNNLIRKKSPCFTDGLT